MQDLSRALILQSSQRIYKIMLCVLEKKIDSTHCIKPKEIHFIKEKQIKQIHSPSRPVIHQEQPWGPLGTASHTLQSWETCTQRPESAENLQIQRMGLCLIHFKALVACGCSPVSAPKSLLCCPLTRATPSHCGAWFELVQPQLLALLQPCPPPQHPALQGRLWPSGWMGLGVTSSSSYGPHSSWQFCRASAPNSVSPTRESQNKPLCKTTTTTKKRT